MPKMRRYHAHVSILVSKKIVVCPGVVVVAVRADTVGQHLEQFIHNKQWYIMIKKWLARGKINNNIAQHHNTITHLVLHLLDLYNRKKRT
jgi:hypothetical protein